MPRVTIPSIRDSFHPKGLCGLVIRGSQGDPSPLTTAQLFPAGPTQCRLPSCEVLGKWLIKSESQGQGQHLRWSAACTLLLAVCLWEMGQPGRECLLAPPSLIFKEAQLGMPSRKGWGLDLMENPALLYQLPPDFLPSSSSCWHTWLWFAATTPSCLPGAPCNFVPSLVLTGRAPDATGSPVTLEFQVSHSEELACS